MQRRKDEDSRSEVTRQRDGPFAVLGEANAMLARHGTTDNKLCEADAVTCHHTAARPLALEGTSNVLWGFSSNTPSSSPKIRKAAKLSHEQSRALKVWFLESLKKPHGPYPDKGTKKMLAEQTGATASQVRVEGCLHAPHACLPHAFPPHTCPQHARLPACRRRAYRMPNACTRAYHVRTAY